MHSATAPILLLPASLDSVPASPYVPSRGLKIIQSHMAAADRWVVRPYLARSGGVEDLSVLYSGKQSWMKSTAVKAMTSDWIVCLVKREVQFWLLPKTELLWVFHQCMKHVFSHFLSWGPQIWKTDSNQLKESLWSHATISPLWVIIQFSLVFQFFKCLLNFKFHVLFRLKVKLSQKLSVHFLFFYV